MDLVYLVQHKIKYHWETNSAHKMNNYTVLHTQHRLWMSSIYYPWFVIAIAVFIVKFWFICSIYTHTKNNVLTVAYSAIWVCNLVNQFIVQRQCQCILGQNKNSQLINNMQLYQYQWYEYPVYLSSSLWCFCPRTFFLKTDGTSHHVPPLYQDVHAKRRKICRSVSGLVNASPCRVGVMEEPLASYVVVHF